MFGKLTTKLVDDRELVSSAPQRPVFSTFGLQCDPDEITRYRNVNKPILDYIITQAGENECPFIPVKLYDYSISGLLDSGADKIYINQSTFLLLKRVGVSFHPVKTKCTVANNSSAECIGYVTVPIRLQHKIEVFDVFVMPELRHNLILGSLFWIRLGIVPGE